MRKSVIVCLLMLAAFSLENAFAVSYQNQFSCDCCWIKEASADLTIGHRTDEFEWKFKDPRNVEIASFFSELDSGLGCVLSEALDLKGNYESQWKHLRMINIGLTGRVDTTCCFSLKGKANYGYICEGVYDPHGVYFGGSEFFEDIASNLGLAPPAKKKSKGHAWDISGGIGYKFCVCCDDFQLIPLVGWSYHNLSLHGHEYKAETRVCVRGLDIFEGLEDSEGVEFFWDGKSKPEYCARWTGPWIGFDAFYTCNCCWDLFASFEYHYARHWGDGHVKSNHEVFLEATENQEATSVDVIFCSDTSFHNRIYMRGVFIGGGINYHINECWYLGFHVDYWNMRRANNGKVCISTDGILRAEIETDGIIDDIELTKNLCDEKRHECLKSMRWESLRFELALGLNF